LAAGRDGAMAAGGAVFRRTGSACRRAAACFAWRVGRLAAGRAFGFGARRFGLAGLFFFALPVARGGRRAGDRFAFAVRAFLPAGRFAARALTGFRFAFRALPLFPLLDPATRLPPGLVATACPLAERRFGWPEMITAMTVGEKNEIASGGRSQAR
jgi:hypothetical protein